MRPATRTLAIVALTTTLMSCSGQSLPATAPVTPEIVPRIYSTTAVSPLLNDLTIGFTDINPGLRIETRQANFQRALEQLYRREMAYFLTNHLPVDSPLWAAPIGQDSIAVIVHPDVNIESLSTEQLRLIYQGRLTSWQQVGGETEDIIVFSREEGSGTRAEFERMVMGYRPTTANARLVSSSTQMIESVLRQAGSIGYVSMGYLDKRLRPVAVNEVMPTPENVTSNIYPLRSTIFMVGLSEPEGIYRAFVAWSQGPQGQEVVETHYAPLLIPQRP
ncbi:MAG: substrate-binding domain-containing protein [Chloroflexota bacterium]